MFWSKVLLYVVQSSGPSVVRSNHDVSTSVLDFRDGVPQVLLSISPPNVVDPVLAKEMDFGLT